MQHCTTASQVRYCLYPGFAPLLPSLEVPVDGVLAHLPARPDQPLTLQQVLPPFLDSTLTHGHPKRPVSQWQAQLQSAPGTAATASVDQAREAIAIWLAILATRPPASELQDGLRGAGGGNGTVGEEVRNTFVPTWAYPGSNAGYLGPSETGPTTAGGYLLAHAMTSLPGQKVARLLTDGWGRWLNWHTTDAQLAAALGIPMPSVPAPPAPPRSSQPGVTNVQQGPGNGPQNPLCTA